MPYAKPPWHFSGQALYQLSLVRVEEARKYMPPELPLVSLFGWTLGGFYLARYSDSPAGAFDELVALAGLAWDFPTSAAWAARVYVNSREARNHGISAVGLPSRLASFRAVPLPQLKGGRGGKPGGAQQQQQQEKEEEEDSVQRQQRRSKKQQAPTWWDVHLPRTGGRKQPDAPATGAAAAAAGTGTGGVTTSGGSTVSAQQPRRLQPRVETLAMELCNEEARGWGALPSLLFGSGGGNGGGQRVRGLASAVCTIDMPRMSPGWAPPISMFLPSFSGGTPEHPGLLKYTLKLSARIRPVPPVRVSFPERRQPDDEGSPEVLDAVLGGRPLLCLSFAQMQMEVAAPQRWEPTAAADRRALPATAAPAAA